jgi:hypothetical protein
MLLKKWQKLKTPFIKKDLECSPLQKKEIEKGQHIADLTGELYQAKKYLAEAKEKLDLWKIEKSLQEFREKFPDFESFFQNKDFAFLISRGVEPILISPEDPRYQELLKQMPYRQEYGFQYAYMGSRGKGIKVLYFQPDGKVDVKEVKQKFYSYEEHAGSLPNEEFEEDGETLEKTLQDSKIGDNNFVIITYDDSSYHRGRLTEDIRRENPLDDQEVPKKGTSVYLVRLRK